MVNSIPELVKVGIALENSSGTPGNWGTAPGGTSILVPCEPPEIREEIAHFVDENVRGVLGRDFEAYGGMRQVTGTLRGNFFGNNDAGSTAVASPQGYMLHAFFGTEEAAQIGVSGVWKHNFAQAAIPDSLTVTVDDELTGANTIAEYLGVNIPRFVVRFDANDGLVTWEADLLGLRQTFPGSAQTLGADLTGESYVGWQASVAIETSKATNPTATTSQVLSFELVMEREISLMMGGAMSQSPTIRAARPMRSTFSAVLEFDSYADLKKYSSDDTSTFSDFTSNQDTWTVRISNDTGITVNTNDTTLGTNLAASTESALDIRLHSVSYGERPLEISRGELPNTLEFNGRVLYDKTATGSMNWFGASPGATATEDGSRVVQLRLVNHKSAVYS